MQKQMMTKHGWCPIEKRTTLFMKCENKKWVCDSGTCSYASGQYEEIPKAPKLKQDKRFVYV